jgi:membrane-bound serine protease (ClpP class)
MLFRGKGPEMSISWAVLLPTVLTVSAFFIIVAGIVFRSHFQRALTGPAGMVGERGVAFTAIAPEGQVFVHGEYWQAMSDEPIAAQEGVEVLEVKDLKLRVRRAR